MGNYSNITNLILKKLNSSYVMIVFFRKLEFITFCYFFFAGWLMKDVSFDQKVGILQAHLINSGVSNNVHVCL